MVKVEKAITNEACKAKKVAKLVAIKLGSTKKLPKKPKGEKEKTYGPLNWRSAYGGGINIKGIIQGENL